MVDARPDSIIKNDNVSQRRTRFGVVHQRFFQLVETGLVGRRQHLLYLVGFGTEIINQKIHVVLQICSAEVFIKFEGPVDAALLLGDKIAVQRYWDSENRRDRDEIGQYRAQNLGMAFGISAWHNTTAGF